MDRGLVFATKNSIYLMDLNEEADATSSSQSSTGSGSLLGDLVMNLKAPPAESSATAIGAIHRLSPQPHSGHIRALAFSAAHRLLFFSDVTLNSIYAIEPAIAAAVGAQTPTQLTILTGLFALQLNSCYFIIFLSTGSLQTCQLKKLS